MKMIQIIHDFTSIRINLFQRQYIIYKYYTTLNFNFISSNKDYSIYYAKSFRLGLSFLVKYYILYYTEKSILLYFPLKTVRSDMTS